MSLSISPLFSSSSGNCTYICTDSASLLVDAGLTGSAITGALASLGKDPRALDGIVITHEHIDHIRGVGVLSRKYDLPVYANEATWEAMAPKLGRIAAKNIRMTDRRGFYIGDIAAEPVGIYHDAADPAGYIFEGGGVRAAVLTDTGKTTPEMLSRLKGVRAVLLEANHDIEMLKNGAYPAYLKKRILSQHGHLSNDDAAKAAVRLAEEGVRMLLLAHLSRENNIVRLAYDTVKDALTAAGADVGGDIALGATKKYDITGYYTLK